MSGEQTPLQRAEEALRAAGFHHEIHNPLCWRRWRGPEDGDDVVRFHALNPALWVKIEMSRSPAALPAVLAALRGEAVPLAAVEEAVEEWARLMLEWADGPGDMPAPSLRTQAIKMQQFVARLIGGAVDA